MHGVKENRTMVPWQPEVTKNDSEDHRKEEKGQIRRREGERTPETSAPFSLMGSNRRTDPNQIIDEGYHTSTGGMKEAAAMCEKIGIHLKNDNPREQYMHDWGSQCSDAKPVRYSWDLKIMDDSDWPITLTFDLVDGQYPLTIGTDIGNYSAKCNRKWPHIITFIRPRDMWYYTIYMYTMHTIT